MKKALIIIALVLMPASLYAEIPSTLRIFKTQGDLNILYHAFNRVALICSDPRYHGLFITVIILSILVTAFGLFGRGLIGSIRLGDINRWFFTFVAGCVIYRAFIVPTTDITIHDETANQTIVVADIPDIIVLLANFSNTIEQGLIHIVETSGGVDGYIENPGGTVFNMLTKMFDTKINLTGTPEGGYKNQINIRNYIEDCVTFEVARPGTDLTFDEIFVNTDFNAVLAKAINPVVYTSDAEGTALSCTQAYQNINNYFSSLEDTHPGIARWLEISCDRAGWQKMLFGAVGPLKLATCKQKSMDFLSESILGEAITSSQLFKQQLVAHEIYKICQSGDPDIATTGLGAIRQGNLMVSTGLISAEWLPKIKAMIFAAFLGMLPFLLLFLASSMWKQVLTFIVGCFIFFSVWGVCDAMLHQFAMEQAHEVMAQIKSYKLGLLGVLHFSSDSMKAYAVFGQYKIWGMMLAVLFSGALTKVGASQLGRIAIMESGALKGTAGSAGSEVRDPASNANALKTYSSAGPTQAIHNKYGYNQSGEFSRLKQSREAMAAQKTIANLGGNPIAAADRASDADLLKTQSGVANVNAMNDVSYGSEESKEQILYNNAVTKAAQDSKNSKEMFKKSDGSLPGLMNTAETVADASVSKQIGGAKGFHAAYENALKNGFKGTPVDFSAFQTEMETTKGFSEASTRQSAADKYFNGNSAKMFDFIKSFNSHKEAGKVHALGDLDSNEKHGGQAGLHEAAESQAISRYISTMGQSGHKLSSSSAMFAKASTAIWNGIMDRALNNEALDPAFASALDSIKKDPIAIGRFNEIGSRGINRPVTSSESIRQSGLFSGIRDDDYELLKDSNATFYLGLTESGDIAGNYFTFSKGYRARSEEVAQRTTEQSSTTNMGTKHSNMLPALLSGKTETYAEKLKDSMDNNNSMSEISAQATGIAEAIGDIMQNQGIIAGSFDLKGSGGAGFGKFASGSVGIGKQNVERESYNLIRSEASRRLQSVVESGDVDNLQLFKEKYDTEITSWVKELNNEANEKTTLDYGASSPAGFARKLLKDAPAYSNVPETEEEAFNLANPSFAK